MKLVAFVGPRGSGKDTCAAIAKEAGLVAGKISFAGPLKRICSEVFDIPMDVFEDPIKKEEVATHPLDMAALGEIIAGMSDYLPMTDAEMFACSMNFAKHFNNTLTSPRHVLQYVGTEIIRAYDPDWHCKAAFSEYNLEQLDVDTSKVYAVTDCRFLNEYAFLNEKHDTRFIYISRPEAEERLKAATHQSEKEIVLVKEKIQHEIDNSYELEELKAQTLGLVRDLV